MTKNDEWQLVEVESLDVDGSRAEKVWVHVV
jgi:hypothetical protein